jgi:ectoine hydroxylase-related dioxygenase (phytanoyl-CoA dioxygenase family)
MPLASTVSQLIVDSVAEGFAIFEDVFSNNECDELLAVLSGTLKRRGRAGTRHLMNNACVAALASDSRLIEIAQGSLGKRLVPYRITLFEKTSRANWLVVWHQDTALPLTRRNNFSDWGPWSNKAGVMYAHAPSWALSRVVALRVHLDASTQDNGPLRVIPGSHARGVLTDEEVLALAREQESVDCLVPRGGVLTMRPLLIHSSSKSQGVAPRRVLHIEYADSLELDKGIQLALA